MFITFEGIDFCGKSTQVNLLKKYLISKNKKVKIIREPGGTAISELIRKILLDKSHKKMSVETEILLFSAARAQLVKEKIKSYLSIGTFVISDRFHDSTTAYQGFGRGIPLETVENINNLAIGENIPNLTFFLDISVEEAEKRKNMKEKSKLDRIELGDKIFFEKVRSGYLYLSDKEKRFITVNGCLSKKEIHQQIIEEIELYENHENVK